LSFLDGFKAQKSKKDQHTKSPSATPSKKTLYYEAMKQG
jgi:hypothetical protein